MVNGILLVVSNVVYTKLVKWFVKWENHKYDNAEEDSIVIKVFCF